MPRKKPVLVPAWIRFNEDGTFWLKTERMASMLEIAERTLQNWAQTEGCPKEALGWWDPAKVIRWRGQVISGEAGDASNRARKEAADAEFREIKTRLALIEFEAKTGAYVSRGEVISAWSARITEVKRGLMALARKVGSRFSDPEIRREVEVVVDEECRDICERFSRDGIHTPRPKG
jgi:hypothetical protein